MWFWTLSTSVPASTGANGEEESEEEEEPAGDEENGKKAKAAGYSLEFDATRKIVQGLGAHLEQFGNHGRPRATGRAKHSSRGDSA
jgi:hypothetical protein